MFVCKSLTAMHNIQQVVVCAAFPTDVKWKDARRSWNSKACDVERLPLKVVSMLVIWPDDTTSPEFSIQLANECLSHRKSVRKLSRS
ncbi:uncharacterized protein K489DRAFT_380209 [Dissoconium aciculare CBS 342.82]|uniref:Uncharacterized protein n=1 Tax=Dissoconium aciculare CBS 342.82 TaxID=1314786 RepID=A0A6J3M4J7_9PEZI|nr:uncharacterized protein K489DRAFT_380209 [Dissoconium aciculare CBS 342.82]KAF1822833.1 hypothetical protein K489DRAFT_380209 [Dissoconium aciculare CBS 342.82]